MKKSREKLYIVGIDSVPVWIVKAVAKKYGLRGFQRFFDSGFIGDMESTLPPVTAAAWPTIYTGVNPGKHGVMEFFSLDRDYNKQLMYYDSEDKKPFWNVLSGKGIRSLVITPAMVLEPTKDRNVDLATGFPLPPRYNSDAIEEAAKRVGFAGEENLENLIKDGKMGLQEGSERYKISVKKRIELAKLMMKEHEYELVFVCFTETDRIQHYSLGSGMEKALKYNAPVLKEIDGFIDWIYRKINSGGEDASLVIVSDHGAQPLKKKFLINTWMIRNGFARLKPAVEQQVQEIFSGAHSGQEIHSNLKYKLREKLVGTGIERAYGKLPGTMKKFAAKSMDVGLTASKDGRYVRVHDLNFDNFDMKGTKAFGAVSTNPVGMIWINDSRFSASCVNVGDKEKLKKDIMNMLSKEKDAEGKRLIKRVYDGKTYYKDTKRFIYPDILVLLREGYGADTFNLSRKGLFIDPDPILNGDHTENAMFGILGKGINVKRIKSGSIKISDFAPTVYKYFGISSKGLDGKPLI